MNTTPQQNVQLFMRGLQRQPNPRALRHVVFLVAQGHWGGIVDLARALKFPAALTVADLKAVLDPRGRITDAVVFRNQLAVNPTLRHRIAALPPGDWEGIRQVAQAEGLAVTVAELKALAPASFSQRWVGRS